MELPSDDCSSLLPCLASPRKAVNLWTSTEQRRPSSLTGTSQPDLRDGLLDFMRSIAGADMAVNTYFVFGGPCRTRTDILPALNGLPRPLG